MSGETAVIGLGQFGQAVARSLASQGQAVLAVDNDMDHIEAVQDVVDVAVQADATDEDALYGLRLEQMSVAIVAMGAHSVEASILTTALLKEMGVPRIIARASNELHARILRSVGANEVIDPEQEMGRRLARRLSQPSIVDQIDLGNAELAEVEAPEAFVGKTLAELDLRNEYHVSVLAIRRGDTVEPNPRAEVQLVSGDIMVVIGRPEAVNRIAALA
ncbi:TrkA family potassium uptake protein [Persicimonas caeni]|uniref:TrkA family potassium uptake protein n=1 Tax=Persicimonas caeni TaxID=2292766 RepID=A0A4Y6PSB5_PERCE|nr:TrkA family potassium uptake protein [Persicimonas caeni]QDG51211.1 TrkA family potassium uptake protein [Persicimonas caeni]QED32432.1 TrkA family potassium uptake protein [Persicimonas caeni]